jgi:hypothetical protein
MSIAKNCINFIIHKFLKNFKNHNQFQKERYRKLPKGGSRLSCQERSSFFDQCVCCQDAYMTNFMLRIFSSFSFINAYSKFDFILWVSIYKYIGLSFKNFKMLRVFFENLLPGYKKTTIKSLSSL